MLRGGRPIDRDVPASGARLGYSRMPRGVALLPIAALLAGPTIVGFSSGGATDTSRLAAAVAAFVILALAAALPSRPTAVPSRGLLPAARSARWALGGLAGFAAWTLLARTWAPTHGRADVAFELAALYLAVVTAAGLLLRRRAVARAVEPALALGALVVVGYGVAGRLVPGLVELAVSPRAGGRLDQPLTYWNAMGALAGLGLVLVTRLAGDETRPSGLRACAAAALPVLGAGVYLSFSRAAIAATAAGILVLVVLAPTRAQLRAAILAAVGTGLGIAATAPFGSVRTLAGTLGMRERQGVAALILLVAATLVIAGAHLVATERCVPRLALPRGWRGAAAVALAVVAVLPFAAALADRSDGGSTTFGASTSRLAAAGSNRSAYWKVAIRSWADHPLAGEGAGSFGETWLRERDIAERVHNAHSIELETASELGLVGVALLALAFGAIGLAARRLYGEDAVLAVGPAAVLVAWLLHASVDWDWQMPALTGVAAILAGLLVARAGARPAQARAAAASGQTAVAAGQATPTGGGTDDADPDDPHVAASVTPPPGHPRFPMLDGVRAIAALSVVVLHVSDRSGFSQHKLAGALTARLNVGVALFFVLSGFLLYRPFVAARIDGRPATTVAHYLRRRALRILPGYWVALAVMAGVGWVSFALGWWRYALFLQPYNIFSLFSGINPAWTLSIEVLFYISLPLWVVIAARLLAGRPRAAQIRAELWAVGALAVFGIAFRTAAALIQNTSLWVISYPAHLAWFAGGMGLALLSLWLEERPAPRLLQPLVASAAACWGTALVAYLLAAYAVGLPRGLTAAPAPWWQNIAGHVLYLVVAVLVALPAVAGGDGARGVSAAIRRLLGHPLALWLGAISYGIFLYHDPFLDWLIGRGFLDSAPGLPYLDLLVVVAGGAIAMGAASYYLVERPFLALKDPRGRSRPEGQPSPPAPSPSEAASAG
jgi:peptidoglycan/LPS O-acetylase OafA/YrhL